MEGRGGCHGFSDKGNTKFMGSREKRNAFHLSLAPCFSKNLQTYAGGKGSPVTPAYVCDGLGHQSSMKKVK